MAYQPPHYNTGEEVLIPYKGGDVVQKVHSSIPYTSTLMNAGAVKAANIVRPPLGTPK